MKKYIFIFLCLLVTMSCEDFLETDDLLNKNDTNFPVKEEDLTASIAAIYQPMAREQWGAFYNGLLASDEAFAGGNGPNDPKSFAIDQLKKNDENMLLPTWTNYYQGIFRANKLLENIDNVEDASETVVNKTIAEAYFMRAWYYFNLARTFGPVPLFTVAENVNKPRATVDEIYGQIALDLNNAIGLFKSETIQDMGPQRLGHANRWAAESLLARVYLFYTGYYQKSELPLAEGGSLSKSQIINYLEDVIDNSGHQLADDFRELWPYTNPLTVEDYPYTAGQGLEWLGEEGDNYETVFAVQFGNRGGWGGNSTFRNQVVTALSIRGQPGNPDVFPFGSGWGQGTVNTKFVEQWENEEPGDPRIQMSVLDVDDPSEGIVDFIAGGWTAHHETRHFNKKYHGIKVWKDKDAKTFYPSYTAPLYGAAEANWIRESQNLVLIRFSDVLLMHSELTETNTGMNLVRDRVGLPSIAYSREALEEERKHELFYEGVRYYDLLRWYGDDAGVILDENQNGVEVLNALIPAVMQYNLTERVKETKGLFPIPDSEITLSGGVIEQNEGWVGQGNL